jgi:hypothetical protein
MARLVVPDNAVNCRSTANWEPNTSEGVRTKHTTRLVPRILCAKSAIHKPLANLFGWAYLLHSI